MTVFGEVTGAHVSKHNVDEKEKELSERLKTETKLNDQTQNDVTC
jgi:hypothetical protein